MTSTSSKLSCTLKGFAAALSLVVVASQADSAPITYGYTLDITKIIGAKGDSPFTGTDGVQVNGAFTIESSTPDADPGDPTLGDYEDGLISNMFYFDWGDGLYMADDGSSDVYRAFVQNQDSETGGVDMFRFQDSSGYADFMGYEFNMLRIELKDDLSATSFTDDSLGTLSLEDFNNTTFLLWFGDSVDRILYKGNVTSWEVLPDSASLTMPGAEVPLPSSLAAMLGGFGLGAVALRRRRCRRPS